MVDDWDDDTSEVLRQFAERIDRYITEQGTEVDRKATMPNPPWPDETNNMLEYLLHRANEIVKCGLSPTENSPSSLPQAAVWLATHAWFEGGLAERRRARSNRPT